MTEPKRPQEPLPVNFPCWFAHDKKESHIPIHQGRLLVQAQGRGGPRAAVVFQTRDEAEKAAQSAGSDFELVEIQDAYALTRFLEELHQGKCDHVGFFVGGRLRVWHISAILFALTVATDNNCA